MQAFLLLDDGTRFYGTPFGARCNAAGQVVFNIAMSGYQKSLVDPSYEGQILIWTYPIIADGGLDGFKTEKAGVKGLIIKELCDAPENWEVVETLDGFLKRNNIAGLKGVDTRALTIKVRDGVTHGMICFEEPDAEQLKSLKEGSANAKK